MKRWLLNLFSKAWICLKGKGRSFLSANDINKKKIAYVLYVVFSGKLPKLMCNRKKEMSAYVWPEGARWDLNHHFRLNFNILSKNSILFNHPCTSFLTKCNTKGRGGGVNMCHSVSGCILTAAQLLDSMLVWGTQARRQQGCQSKVTSADDCSSSWSFNHNNLKSQKA